MIQNLHHKKMMQSLRSDIITSAASPARRKGERRHPAASSIYEPTTGLIMAKRLTTEDFISRAKQKHGDKYIYDKLAFSGTKNQVTITCRKHGDFTQKAECHLAGYGCELCARDVRARKLMASNDEFISKAKMVHGGKYSYDKCVYTGTHRKVVITCQKHGDFSQQPANHLSGNGCPLCKLENLSDKFSDNKSSFITKAKAIHGKRYSYEKVNYVRSSRKVWITCHIHGDFYQTPNSHLRGSGCNKCTAYGFKPANLYVAEMDGMCKIGISNNTKRRMKSISKSAGKTVTVVAEYSFPSWADARRAESMIHKEIKHKNAGLTGFDGASEFFNISTHEAADLVLKHGGKGQ